LRCRFIPFLELGIDDINSERNGLLSKPLEWAFDTGRASILHDPDFNPPSYQCYIVDPSILETTLLEKFLDLNPQALKRCAWLARRPHFTVVFVGCQG
jgi:hypothetical protein